jgi:hypothetical protein
MWSQNQLQCSIEGARSENPEPDLWPVQPYDTASVIEQSTRARPSRSLCAHTAHETRAQGDTEIRARGRAFAAPLPPPAPHPPLAAVVSAAAASAAIAAAWPDSTCIWPSNGFGLPLVLVPGHPPHPKRHPLPLPATPFPTTQTTRPPNTHQNCP